MAINQLQIVLPGVDAITQKSTLCTHRFLVLDENLEMRHSRILTFIEADGTPCEATNELEKKIYVPHEIVDGTKDQWVDPATGAVVDPATPGAISELEYWQNIPLAAYPGIASLPDSVKSALAGIKISDTIYWLMQQSMIAGRVQNHRY
jgi:hypothetical protein